MRDRCLATLLRLNQQLQARLYEQTPGAAILTVPAYIVMRALLNGEAFAQIDLVRATGVDRSTISKILEGLAHHGFIVRTRDEDDQRSVMVIITHKGRKGYQSARLHFDRIETEMFSALPPGARDALRSYLEKTLTAHATKERPHARRSTRNSKRNRNVSPVRGEQISDAVHAVPPAAGE